MEVCPQQNICISVSGTLSGKVRATGDELEKGQDCLKQKIKDPQVLWVNSPE